MSDPVLITLIVCATLVVLIFGLAGIQLLEKHNDKANKKPNEEKEWPDDLPPM